MNIIINELQDFIFLRGWDVLNTRSDQDTNLKFKSSNGSSDRAR